MMLHSAKWRMGLMTLLLLTSSCGETEVTQGGEAGESGSANAAKTTLQGLCRPPIRLSQFSVSLSGLKQKCQE